MSHPTNPDCRSGHRARTGATLVELLVAGILMTTVVVLIGPLMLQSSQVRRTATQRQLATQIASNCLERLAAGESRQVATTEVMRGWDTQQWLPDIKLGVIVRDDAGRRRATVSVNWTTPAGHAARPVQLSGWFADDQEISP